MNLSTIKNTILRTFLALILFFIAYLPLFATTPCDCLASTCAAGKMRGFFLCNACNCLTIQDALIQFFLYGVTPFIVFFIIAYFLIRD
ncbi:MAG: hypothetical protein WC462_01730 [archaeon]